MWEKLAADPGYLAPLLTIISICLAIVLSIWIAVWRSNEKGKRDNDLKMEMVARGMSADDILRVLNAKSDNSRLAETVYQQKKCVGSGR